MKHTLGTLPVDGQDNVARPEVGSLSLAPLGDLQGMRNKRSERALL